jgi:hypothetical protein
MSPARQRVESQSVETALQRQQRELDLDQFVDVLVKGGIAAWHDEELQPPDRALFLRQSSILSAAVAKLKTLLDDADPEIRLARLITLHEALGAVALIARQRMEDPAADRVLKRLLTWESAATAREGISAKKDRRDEIIIAVAKPFVQRHPTEGPWQIAPRAIEEINRQLEARNRGKMKPDTIARHLKDLWPRLVPLPEK